MSDSTATAEPTIEAIEAEIAERQQRLVELKAQQERKKTSGLPANIVAVKEFCYLDGARYALNGIKIEIKNGRYSVAATDSRGLAVLSGDAGDFPDVETIVDQTHLVAAVSANGADANTLAGSEGLILHVEADPAKKSRRVDIHSFRDGKKGASIASMSPEGRFPKYRDVIPSGDVTLRIFFDPKLLARAMELCSKFTTGEKAQVAMEFRGPDTPVVLKPFMTGDRDQELLVVLMPMLDANA